MLYSHIIPFKINFHLPQRNIKKKNPLISHYFAVLIIQINCRTCYGNEHRSTAREHILKMAEINDNIHQMYDAEWTI